MEPASMVYEAELDQHGLPRLGTTMASHLRGAEPSTVDLVVRRKADGAEIIRTAADLGSPDALLTTVESDLASMTADEFLAEWKMPENL